MKKIICLMLIGLFVMGAAGCGKTEAPDHTQASTADETTGKSDFTDEDLFDEDEESEEWQVPDPADFEVRPLGEYVDDTFSYYFVLVTNNSQSVCSVQASVSGSDAEGKTCTDSVWISVLAPGETGLLDFKFFEDSAVSNFSDCELTYDKAFRKPVLSRIQTEIIPEEYHDFINVKITNNNEYEISSCWTSVFSLDADGKILYYEETALCSDVDGELTIPAGGTGTMLFDTSLSDLDHLEEYDSLVVYHDAEGPSTY